jgi:thioredoxin reductase
MMAGMGTRGAKFTREEMMARICPKERFPEIIDIVVKMCKKYKSCGFDGMSFRCDWFLDADTNLRTDEYGGEIENRGRFNLELFTAIKNELGSDFIIEAAMPGKSEHGHNGEIRHGYSLDEAVRYLKTVEDVIDIVQIREQNGAVYQCSTYNSKLGEHKCLEYCRALREAGFTRAISVNGGFHDPADMESALQSGVCDLITTSRAFIADPMLIRKLTSPGAEYPTPCIRCNKCHGTGTGGSFVSSCSVNPKAGGMVHRLPGIVKPPLRLKKVAIIGGGPIGMRAACFAAERGHKVTLFEKTGYLGGKLKHADMFPFKWTFRQYRLWLIDELARRGVEVKMNRELTPDELRSQDFDAIIACTGSVAKRPDVEGADAAGVYTCEDVYEGRAVIGQRVVMVGGGEIGTDVAMYLAEQGKDITVLTRQDILMKKDFRAHGYHQQHEIIIPELGYGYTGTAWEIYTNLTPVYNAVTLRVTPDSVTYLKDGVEATLTCDSVVVNGGYRGCIEEALRYVGCAPELFLAGDVEEDMRMCLQQGNVSAFGKACLL